MPDVPVFFVTTEGQTRLIADRIAQRLREHAIDAQAIQVGSAEAAGLDLLRARGVILGASLHFGKHQRVALAFARDRLSQLGDRPSLFFSVSLGILSKSAEQVAVARAAAEAFPMATGWHPTRIVCLPGRLAYTQYGWFMRRVMRRIAAQAGMSTDMTRDHEYTDWNQVRTAADQFAEAFHARADGSIQRSA
jgi:menaquinone-dependent protoporphyrinogen oxidase